MIVHFRDLAGLYILELQNLLAICISNSILLASSSKYSGNFQNILALIGDQLPRTTYPTRSMTIRSYKNQPDSKAAGIEVLNPWPIYGDPRGLNPMR